MVRRWLPFALALLPALSAQSLAPPQAGAGLQKQIAVPLHDGRLQVDELMRALLAAYQFDAEVLELPAVRVDLRGVRGALLLYGGRKLLLDTVAFRRDIEAQQLLLEVDRERARQLRRQLRRQLARFAGRLAGREVALQSAELALPQPLDPGRPLLVLVHGLDGDPGEFADLAAFLQAPPQCCQVATFRYANDAAAEQIAQQLGAELRALGSQPVALVGHSLGGLIARAVVEDPALDPGNVRTLVQIGAPNRGSNLAGLRLALEAQDLLQQDDAAALLDRVIARFRDGVGEAGGDLLPDSVFLTRLAGRGRNPRVDYHLLLGTRSLLTTAQLQQLRRELQRRLDGSTLGELLRPRLLALLADLDELVDGKGDGAVSVARGRLDGVDAVLVPLDHVGLVRLRGLLGRTPTAAEHPVFRRVAGWCDVMPTIWVGGIAVDQGGAPVPAAAIRILGPSGAVVASARADGEGVFRLPLPPGANLQLQAAAAGKLSVPLSLCGGNVVLRLRDVAELRGVVRTADGAPCAGALVYTPDWTWAQAVTAADGSFALAPVPLGTTTVQVLGDGMSAAAAVPVPSAAPLALQLGGDRHRDRLLIGVDLPAGALSDAYFTVSPAPPRLQRLPLRADGTAVLPVLPHAHNIRLVAPGLQPRPMLQRCAAGAGDDLEFHVAPLPPPALSPLSGSVRDEAGNGVVGLAVACFDRDGHRVGVTTTQAGGAFSLQVPLPLQAHCTLLLHTGERLVRGADGNGCVGFAAAVASPVDLVLEPGAALAAQLVDAGGAPLPFAQVALDVVRVRGGKPAQLNAAVGTADAGGRLLLRGLAAGRYAVRVSGREGTFGEAMFVVEANQVAQLGALQYRATTAVVGQLRDAAGRPLAGAELWLQPQVGRDRNGWPRIDAGYRASDSVVTDAEGRFRLPGLLPGTYEPRVDGRPLRPFEVGAGAPLQVELQLPR